jgi:hypothetical protein
MVRTQIQLEERQVADLKRIAIRKHVSMAEVIRLAVDRYTASPEAGNLAERKARALAAAGKFRSGVGDISTRHDDYLAEAYRK